MVDSRSSGCLLGDSVSCIIGWPWWCHMAEYNLELLILLPPPAAIQMCTIHAVLGREPCVCKETTHLWLSFIPGLESRHFRAALLLQTLNILQGTQEILCLRKQSEELPKSLRKPQSLKVKDSLSFLLVQPEIHCMVSCAEKTAELP